MKADMNKQYLLISGKPILAHTIEAFERCEIISEIIIVIHHEDRKLFEECILPFGFSKITSVVDGGADRQASVYRGLQRIDPACEIIMVHDGARPFIHSNIITDSVNVAKKQGVACVGVPVKDTIKMVNSVKRVDKTLERSLLWAVQTPQVFKRDILIKAHEKAIEEGYRGTDDSVLAERLGIPVHMVMGSYSNIKITTIEDLAIAEAIVNR
ncbi:MAG: 2-C-methyl-D-erythritol 4-phosphate cytidylyltransferase [Clostridiaceae bacterium]|nr:2-C-methyl-D-erythritol 4-phosphate cytidylyltransferase [Clostridiaceae bacterium]